MDWRYKNKVNLNYIFVWLPLLHEARMAKRLMVQIIGIKIPSLKTEKAMDLLHSLSNKINLKKSLAA